MDNKAAGQYLARVKRALVCDKTDRCRLLERCGDMIAVFQQENPEAGYDGIVAAFGEPDAFVAELLSGLDESKVVAARKRRRLIRWGGGSGHYRRVDCPVGVFVHQILAIHEACGSRRIFLCCHIPSAKNNPGGI